MFRLLEDEEHLIELISFFRYFLLRKALVSPINRCIFISDFTYISLPLSLFIPLSISFFLSKIMYFAMNRQYTMICLSGTRYTQGM